MTDPNPVRIQRKRTKGWHGQSEVSNGLPIEYVHRPLRYGNPYTFKPGDHAGRVAAVTNFESALRAGALQFTCEDVRKDLKGKNLGCYCSLDEICHADVLLKIANEEES